MWRCKWAELKIKEFGSQAIKCDREIFALNQRKHTSLHQHPVEESGSRSLPYTLQEQKQKVLKRRKRERVEDKVDTKSYMSNHNLFSYLGKFHFPLRRGNISLYLTPGILITFYVMHLTFAGDKRSYQDGTLIADDLCNTGNNRNFLLSYARPQISVIFLVCTGLLPLCSSSSRM